MSQGNSKGLSQVTAQSIITDWTAFPSVEAGTLITATTTNPTYGTVSVNRAFWRRVGDSMEIYWEYTQTAAGSGAVGSGTYLFNLPQGYTIDTTKITVNANGFYHVGGGIFGYDATTTPLPDRLLHVAAYSNTQLTLFYDSQAGGPAIRWASGASGFSTANLQISMKARVPIVGWTSTQIIGTPKASDAEVIAGTDDTKYVSPQKLRNSPQVAKAWVLFNGAGGATITASHNITSISRSAAGTYIVTTSIPITNMVPVCSAVTTNDGVGSYAGHAQAIVNSSTQLTIYCVEIRSGYSYIDANPIRLVIYGS